MQWTKLSPVGADDDDEKVDDKELLIVEDSEGTSSTEAKKFSCSKRGPSLIVALFRTFRGPLLAASFFKFCQDTLMFFSPMLLR